MVEPAGFRQRLVDARPSLIDVAQERQCQRQVTQAPACGSATAMARKSRERRIAQAMTLLEKGARRQQTPRERSNWHRGYSDPAAAWLHRFAPRPIFSICSASDSASLCSARTKWKTHWPWSSGARRSGRSSCSASARARARVSATSGAEYPSLPSVPARAQSAGRAPAARGRDSSGRVASKSRPLPQLRHRFRHRRARDRLLTGLEPVADRLLVEAGLGAMLRQELRLSGHDLRELALQRRRRCGHGAAGAGCAATCCRRRPAPARA